MKVFLADQAGSGRLPGIWLARVIITPRHCCPAARCW